MLSRHFHLLIPELRGHGQSSASNAYGVFDFLLHLHEVITALEGKRLALWGHSLGVHLVGKLAAIFPNRIDAVAIIGGLGPPHRAHESDEAAEMHGLQFMILIRLRQKPGGVDPFRTRRKPQNACCTEISD